MISWFIGVGNLLIGLGYGGLGVLSAWEAISLHRYRGWSRFGIGFSLMAASCGPHHLVHGLRVLQGEAISLPMLVATLIGLPAGLTFVALRIEAIWGGRGDRCISFTERRAAPLVCALAIVGGWLCGAAFARPEADLPFQILCTPAGLALRATGSGGDVVSITFIANMFVSATYGMVGWYIVVTQARGRQADGAWSLSGLALAGVFFTCALMHIVDATTRDNNAMVLFDLIGVPASVYFLRIVKQVHNDSVMDWNRRPLVGHAASPARPSPWKGESVLR
jgi:hypothetical protein